MKCKNPFTTEFPRPPNGKMSRQWRWKHYSFQRKLWIVMKEKIWWNVRATPYRMQRRLSRMWYVVSGAEKRWMITEIQRLNTEIGTLEYRLDDNVYPRLKSLEEGDSLPLVERELLAAFGTEKPGPGCPR